MTTPHQRRSTLTLLAVGAAFLSCTGVAEAQVAFNNRGINACANPGVKDYMVGDGISQGITFRPCPNYVPPVAATPTPAPVDTPAPAPAPTPDATPVDTSSPAPDDTPAPTPVYVPPPPPPQRIPVAVPTYTPWIATSGADGNAIGSGNGSASYDNGYNNVAPRVRAAVGAGDWCHRGGRSISATEACLKAVGTR